MNTRRRARPARSGTSGEGDGGIGTVGKGGKSAGVAKEKNVAKGTEEEVVEGKGKGKEELRRATRTMRARKPLGDKRNQVLGSVDEGVSGKEVEVADKEDEAQKEEGENDQDQGSEQKRRKVAHPKRPSAKGQEREQDSGEGKQDDAVAEGEGEAEAEIQDEELGSADGVIRRSGRRSGDHVPSTRPARFARTARPAKGERKGRTAATDTTGKKTGSMQRPWGRGAKEREKQQEQEQQPEPAQRADGCRTKTKSRALSELDNVAEDPHEEDENQVEAELVPAGPGITVPAPPAAPASDDSSEIDYVDASLVKSYQARPQAQEQEYEQERDQEPTASSDKENQPYPIHSTPLAAPRPQFSSATAAARDDNSKRLALTEPLRPLALPLAPIEGVISLSSDASSDYLPVAPTRGPTHAHERARDSNDHTRFPFHSSPLPPPPPEEERSVWPPSDEAGPGSADDPFGFFEVEKRIRARRAVAIVSISRAARDISGAEEEEEEEEEEQRNAFPLGSPSPPPVGTLLEAADQSEESELSDLPDSSDERQDYDQDHNQARTTRGKAGASSLNRTSKNGHRRQDRRSSAEQGSSDTDTSSADSKKRLRTVELVKLLPHRLIKKRKSSESGRGRGRGKDAEGPEEGEGLESESESEGKEEEEDGEGEEEEEEEEGQRRTARKGRAALRPLKRPANQGGKSVAGGAKARGKAQAKGKAKDENVPISKSKGKGANKQRAIQPRSARASSSNSSPAKVAARKARTVGTRTAQKAPTRGYARRRAREEEDEDGEQDENEERGAMEESSESEVSFVAMLLYPALPCATSPCPAVTSFIFFILTLPSDPLPFAPCHADRHKRTPEKVTTLQRSGEVQSRD